MIFPQHRNQQLEGCWNERKRTVAHDRKADYCFRAQIEWETFFTTWPPYIGAEEINRIIKEFYLNREQGVPLPERTEVNLETKHRIDVYAQLRANWERFSDYVWKEGQK